MTQRFEDGYVFILPPHILLYECGYAAGQFPKFADEVFHISQEESQQEGQFLLPTAETALINLHRDEILEEAELPKKYFAFTPCYRKEVGSYRAAERGTMRGHQFNKVEMFQFVMPDQAESALGELVGRAETILNKLIQEHPDLYMVQYGMGTLQAMKGNYTDSISHYDKCLAIFPYFVEAWYNRGNACRELVKISEIVKSYQKVVEFGDPQEEFVQRAKAFLTDMAASVSEDTGLSLAEYVESNDTFNNAFASLQNREYEKAIIGFDKVLRFHKNNAQTYGNLGLCHAFLGQREKALAFFDQALEVDPAYAPAISNRAIVAELKEGEKMPDDQVKTVEYYKELEEIREEMKGENQQG